MNSIKKKNFTTYNFSPKVCMCSSTVIARFMLALNGGECGMVVLIMLECEPTFAKLWANVVLHAVAVS